MHTHLEIIQSLRAKRLDAARDLVACRCMQIESAVDKVIHLEVEQWEATRGNGKANEQLAEREREK